MKKENKNESKRNKEYPEIPDLMFQDVKIPEPLAPTPPIPKTATRELFNFFKASLPRSISVLKNFSILISLFSSISNFDLSGEVSLRRNFRFFEKKLAKSFLIAFY